MDILGKFAANINMKAAGKMLTGIFKQNNSKSMLINILDNGEFEFLKSEEKMKCITEKEFDAIKKELIEANRELLNLRSELYNLKKENN